MGVTRWSEKTATLDFGSTREVKVEWAFGSEVAELQMTCNVSPGGTGSWGEPKSDTAAFADLVALDLTPLKPRRGPGLVSFY